MNFKRFETQIPSEYQELTFISNNGTQYIDTGLKGSDLADCELEIVMRNDTATLTSYNFNGTFLSGSTAQFGLVATSNSECRSSMNFGFADAISTTGLSLSEFHTIYATNGLQKVDNAVVGTLNFGTLNNGSFLLFARTDPNQPSGINICAGMSLKSFNIKRNNQYIRNMIPVKRKSDNTFGLYDTANGVFYTNQGTGDFTGGTVVESTWHDIPHYIHNTSTDTLTTLPADIYANDTTATVELKGQMEQSGTPTPTTPIQPQECGERTGNLFDKNNNVKPWFINSSSYAIQSSTSGSYSIVIKCEPNTTLCCQMPAYAAGQIPRIVEFDHYPSVGDIGSNYHDYNSPNLVYSTSNTAKYVVMFIYNGGAPPSVSPDVFFSATMVNEGSTPLPYEPYGVKIPILSNSTTTPVYLGEVQSTRQIKQLVLTGQENIIKESGNAPFRIPTPQLMTPSESQILWLCTHYQSVPNSASWIAYDNMISWSTVDTGYKSLRIRDINYNSSSIDTYKSYLQQQYAAGTPVTIWYVLETPTTGIVNEPLRKIGDYADTVSGITISTIAGANTLSIDTTLQPSEVTVNYKGWHPVADVHERENGQWD